MAHLGMESMFTGQGPVPGTMLGGAWEGMGVSSAPRSRAPGSAGAVLSVYSPTWPPEHVERGCGRGPGFSVFCHLMICVRTSS